MAEERTSFSATLGQLGLSQTTFPYGPDWSTVKPYKAAANVAPKPVLPTDMGTTRRLSFPRPPATYDAKTLRYPGTYVPPPQEPYKKWISCHVKFMGAGCDGMVVPVRVRSTGTVAEVITTAVEALRCQSGATVSYNNLRVTGLFNESGRPLSAGYRLHSQGQVPFVKEGSVMTLKVLP